MSQITKDTKMTRSLEVLEENVFVLWNTRLFLYGII